MSQLKKLRKEFNRVAPIAKAKLVEMYGQAQSDEIERDARHELESIAPIIPFVTGVRAILLNTFMRITILELVLYKAMKKQGFPADQAWEICHYTLRKRNHPVPKWKRWLSRMLFGSNLTKTRMQRREDNKEHIKIGKYDLSFLGPRKDRFDFGVNYHSCQMHQFVEAQGAKEFAPFICMSDIVLSEEYGWGLQRTQTLADGAEFCDFRFRCGQPTAITSLTNEVQRTVERIAEQEKNE